MDAADEVLDDDCEKEEGLNIGQYQAEQNIE